LIQLTGVPIGGFLSSAILGLVLSARESTMDGHRWKTLANKWRLNLPRNKVVSCSRYEDDLLLCSFLLCCECTHTVVDTTYGRDAHFDRNRDNERSYNNAMINKFLDTQVTITPTAVSFDLYYTNWEFINNTGEIRKKIVSART